MLTDPLERGKIKAKYTNILLQFISRSITSWVHAGHCSALLKPARSNTSGWASKATDDQILTPAVEAEAGTAAVPGAMQAGAQVPSVTEVVSFGAGAKLPPLSCLPHLPTLAPVQQPGEQSRAEHITCGTQPTGSHFSSLFPRFSSAATPLPTPINKAQNKKLWKPSFTISLKAAVSDGVNEEGGNSGGKQEMKVHFGQSLKHSSCEIRRKYKWSERQAHRQLPCGTAQSGKKS